MITGANTVVIADDDRTLLHLMQRYLADDGYAIRTAEDGAEAKKIIEADGAEIAAVVTDWSMPVMSGIELLRWIKSDEPRRRIPVIMETAMSRAEDIKTGIDAGAFYYIVKPFEKTVLRSIVRAAVGDFRTMQALLKRIAETEAFFGLLDEGVFRFRTNEEAEALALQIAGSSPEPQKALIIAELLLNAVEHGNLGITYEEKTDLIEKGNLKSEVRRRLSLPENDSKTVELRFRREDDALVVEIKDAGEGFDYGRFLEMDERRVFDNHGRGIAMVHAQYRIEYLGKGNHVRVRLPAKQPGSASRPSPTSS